MSVLAAALPVLAAAFAIPQFMPQIVKLARTGDSSGVSLPWSALTSVNNAAWLVYFAASGYWFALLPSSSASLLAGVLTVMLVRRGVPARAGLGVAAAWMTLLAAVYVIAGRGPLGVVLTVAFLVQVVPSLWTAYTTPRPTGIARGTWWLVLGELACWGVFGVHQRDAPLIVLGASGIVAAALMLHRAHATARAARGLATRAGPTRA